MALPVPDQYDNWKDFANALLQVLSSGDQEIVSGSSSGSGAALVPPGYQPLWLQTGINDLYSGNVFGTAPTAPDIVFIDTAQIANAAITGTKIAIGAVGTTNIVDAAIVSAKIGDLQVATAKIADLAVNNAKIANLAVSTANIIDLAVNNAKIGLLAVGTANIIDASILTAKIGDLQVVTAKIAALAVTNAQIANATINTANIANAQITNALIATAAVNSAQIINATIATADIGNAQITNALIANLAVGTAQIAALAVGSAQIAALAVTSAKIADLNVTTLKIADLNVTTNKTDYGVGGNSSVFFDSSNTVNFASAAWVDVGSVTLTSEQGMMIEGMFTCVLIDTAGTSTQAQYQLLRDDGTVILTPQVVAARDEGESFMVMWLDAVNAGRTTTYTMQMSKAGGSTNNVACKPRFMKVTEHVRSFYDQITMVAPAGQGPGRGTAGGGNINGGGHPLDFYY